MLSNFRFLLVYASYLNLQAFCLNAVIYVCQPSKATAFDFAIHRIYHVCWKGALNSPRLIKILENLRDNVN